MAALLVPSFNNALKQLTYFFTIPICTLGVIGACLNIIVFLSLKTFRQSSCAFYLLFMSIFDLGRFIFSILQNILWFGFRIDWRNSSFAFCKINITIFHICISCSMTCLCLAILDQYLATSTRPRWQQWANIKLAYRLITIIVTFWMLHSIPYTIYYTHITPLTTNQTICQITNSILINYFSYGYLLTLTNLIPILTVIFGLLAYLNARNIAYRTVPLVRRELDKQLTAMVLVQVLISFCTFLPYSISTMYTLMTMNVIDFDIQAKKNFSNSIILYFSYIGFSTPFYTYICVSKRFRRQLRYVFFEVSLQEKRQNEVGLEPMTSRT